VTDSVCGANSIFVPNWMWCAFANGSLPACTLYLDGGPANGLDNLISTAR